MADDREDSGPPWLARLSRLVWTVVVVTMSVLALRDRLPLVRHNHDVGHADEAAYALQARGLALHGSSKVPYVSVFFRKYVPSIWRHDDHWPPLLGWVLAPFFRWKGVDAAVGRAVCVGLGALALPLAVAWLGAASTRRGWVAVATAALMLADTLVFQESLRILSDVLMASCVAGFAAAVLAGSRNPRWFWVAGACAAGATLAKGSQVMLLGLLPVGAVLVGGWRALRDRKVWGGVAVGLALLLPWWATMFREYGHPFHSTQNAVSSFYGIAGGWDESFYRVHWDETPPGLADRFRDLPRWKTAARRNAEVFLRSALLGEEARRNEWDALGRFGNWVRRTLLDEPHRKLYFGRAAPALRRPWRTAFHGWALLWGAGVLAWWLFRPLALGTGLTFRRRRGPVPRNRQPAREGPSLIVGGGAFLALLVLAQAGFVIALWSAEQIRFTLGLMPFLAVLGCGGVAALLRPLEAAGRWLGDKLQERIARPGNTVAWRRVSIHGLQAAPSACSVALAVALCAGAVRWHRPLLDWQRATTGVAVHEAPFYPTYHAVAASLERAGVGADAVVMTRNPWELLFYAPVGMRAVGLPYAVPDELEEVARHYGATHFVYDKDRPGLRHAIGRHRMFARQVAFGPFPVYALSRPGAQ